MDAISAEVIFTKAGCSPKCPTQLGSFPSSCLGTDQASVVSHPVQSAVRHVGKVASNDDDWPG